MPGGDGTGPTGAGRGTGRGAGPCGGGAISAGRGRGRGRSGERVWRRRFADRILPAAAPADEREALRAQAEEMQEALARVERRLQELEESKP